MQKFLMLSITKLHLSTIAVCRARNTPFDSCHIPSQPLRYHRGKYWRTLVGDCVDPLSSTNLSPIGIGKDSAKGLELACRVQRVDNKLHGRAYTPSR